MIYGILLIKAEWCTYASVNLAINGWDKGLSLDERQNIRTNDALQLTLENKVFTKIESNTTSFIQELSLKYRLQNGCYFVSAYLC